MECLVLVAKLFMLLLIDKPFYGMYANMKTVGFNFYSINNYFCPKKYITYVGLTGNNKQLKF